VRVAAALEAQEIRNLLREAEAVSPRARRRRFQAKWSFPYRLTLTRGGA
jgi:hypothetical protein